MVRIFWWIQCSLALLPPIRPTALSWVCVCVHRRCCYSSLDAHWSAPWWAPFLCSPASVLASKYPVYFLFFLHMFIQREQICYFVSRESLVFWPFYITGFHEHALWGYLVALLVFSTGYSVHWVERWLIVYLYNTSQCLHDNRMIFESPFTFMWSLLLNYILFYCFVLCNVASVSF